MNPFKLAAAGIAIAVTLFSSSVDAQTAQPVANFYPVTGANRYSSGTFERRKINELAANDRDCFNMYILAMVRMPWHSLHRSLQMC